MIIVDLVLGISYNLMVCFQVNETEYETHLVTKTLYVHLLATFYSISKFTL